MRWTFECRWSICKINTAQKLSKYGVVSGPYFIVFGLNMGNYGPKKSAYGFYSRSVIELEERSRRNNL